MANSTEAGAFVPLTQVYDIATLSTMDPTSQDFKDFLVWFRQYLNNIALVLNIKDSGYYLPQEFVNGQLWFADPALNPITANSQLPQLRQVYRQVVNFGALPNTATKSVAHGIAMTAVTTATRIYGAASDIVGQTFLPLPYASATGSDIELNFDATNINITTTADRTNYTICYVVLEYLKY
jgi:hypothetical protein